MSSDALNLQDLYNETLVRELIEKTKTCGLVWNHLGGTQFQATEIESPTPDPDITWDIFVTKTAIGNATFKYTLDIKKDAVAYITLNDGPLPFTERDSVVKELYDTVELIVLEMDAKVKETLRFIQGITDCRS
jgi:hypothetical protein